MLVADQHHKPTNKGTNRKDTDPATIAGSFFLFNFTKTATHFSLYI
jgi:hypothetical protein